MAPIRCIGFQNLGHLMLVRRTSASRLVGGVTRDAHILGNGFTMVWAKVKAMVVRSAR